LKRLLVAIVVVVVLIAGYALAADRPTLIPTYRVVDQQHLILRAQTAAAVVIRATRVDETADSVIVVVQAIGLPLPSTGNTLTDVPIALTQPLGQRAVIDGSSGQEVTLLQDITPE
jgi:hypothetical protein